MGIVILPDTTEPGIWTLNDTLTISYSLTYLFGGEEEFIFVLDHEFGHLKMKHVRARTPVDWFRYETDFVLMERQELAADSFAIDALKRQGYNPCIGLKMIKRQIFAYDAEDDPTNRYYPILLKRESLLRATCPVP